MSGATNNVSKVPHLVIIDGVVGAGKSTLINNLSQHLNAVVVPEYIDEPNGVLYLNQYLNNKSAYAYDFQLYILKYYHDYINSNTFIAEAAKADYVIMERNPLRGITFFAKRDLLNGYITVEQYQDLYFKALKLLSDIRHAFNMCNLATSYNTTSMLPSDISSEVAMNIDLFDEIDLIADPESIKERILKRNREGEIGTYDDEYIQYMCMHYWD